jgi:hypothetical protein
MSDPWWIVSTSSENGQPFNVELGQGTAAQAKAADSAGLKAPGWPKGPFTSQAAATAAAKQQNITIGGTVQLGTSPLNPGPIKSVGIPGVGSVKVPNITNPLAGIADFFQRLGEASTWERIGLFIGGGVLVYIGLKASFGETAAGQAVKHGVEKTKNAGIKAATVAAL